jgi:hypothetical protein
MFPAEDNGQIASTSNLKLKHAWENISQAHTGVDFVSLKDKERNVNLLFLGKFVLLSKADRIPFYLA